MIQAQACVSGDLACYVSLLLFLAFEAGTKVLEEKEEEEEVKN